jgi:hypothetical protein
MKTLKTTIRYELVAGLYTTPEPSLIVTCPKGTDYRLVMAELHKLAAKVIGAAYLHANEYGWSPEPRLREDGTAAGRVRIELDNGTTEEIKAAERVLRMFVTPA